MKFALVLFSLVFANSAFASFLDECVFESEILGVSSIGKLGTSVSYQDSKTALIIRVLKANSISGDTNCQGYIGGVHAIEIDTNTITNYAVNQIIKLRYFTVNSTTPNGVMGTTQWSIIEDEVGVMEDRPVKINSAKYDANSDELVLSVSYSGGCAQHEFSLEIGMCMETFPVQCMAKLIHKTNDDCEAWITSDNVRLSLKNSGLKDSYFQGASISISGDYDSSASVKLPM